MDGQRIDQSPPPLDGFTFGRCLGRGGMSTVWEAYQRDPGRVVAVKILNEDISARPGEIDSFYAEAKTAAALIHPNIVPVFEVGVQRGKYYYCVMELAAGYDTGKWLARKGRLAEADALTIAESVAVALDYASKTLGIIHCDVKPANIMVDGNGMVRITDMGLARLRRTADNEYITGTPAYMSPEQASGDAVLDERTDIYSLGATIYHLLAGHTMFPGRNDDETMECQRTAPAPEIREANPDVTEACAAMLRRLLAKSPDDRPQTWAEVLEIIHAVMDGKMPPDPPATKPRSKLRVKHYTIHPTNRPTDKPTNGQTDKRTNGPTDQRTNGPTGQPTNGPTGQPTNGQTGQPANGPTDQTSAFWFWTLLAAAAAFAVAFAAARLA